MTPDYKIGICKWCDERGDVFRDNMLCDDCDSNTIYCIVCRCRQGDEDHCRHVFQDEGFEWRGAGFAPCDQDMHHPFHRLLSAMGEDFVRDLKSAIKSGEFYTWMVAPMIGGGGHLSLYGMPDRDGKWTRRDYGDALIKLGEGPQADVLADGYRWLVSLYKRNTTKANRTTIAWIDQWLWPFTPTSRCGESPPDREGT
jgi:hypothetical protein